MGNQREPRMSGRSITPRPADPKEGCPPPSQRRGEVPEKQAMREVEEKLEALAAEIRALSEIVEASKQASHLPLVLSYERAAREMDISVPTLKRMLARGQIRSVRRGDGVGISRSEVLRIAAGQKVGSSRKRPDRAKAPRGSTEREKIRAALRDASKTH